MRGRRAQVGASTDPFLHLAVSGLSLAIAAVAAYIPACRRRSLRLLRYDTNEVNRESDVLLFVRGHAFAFCGRDGDNEERRSDEDICFPNIPSPFVLGRFGHANHAD